MKTVNEIIYGDDAPSPRDWLIAQLRDEPPGTKDEWAKLYLQEWPSEPIPQDLGLCNKCRKVVGNYKFKYGAECQCDSVLRRA